MQQYMTRYETGWIWLIYCNIENMILWLCSLGCRWTDEEKVFALSIYYRSRQAYCLLRSTFSLPSQRTLQSFVGSIPASCGFMESVFQLMAEKVKVMEPTHRLCVVVFDEMSLRKELRYNPAADTVDGVVELPDRRNEVCNQALVFMARGLAANWKQPLGFFFSSNAAGSSCLRELLLTVLERLFSIGLVPVVVVCDQASTNRSLLSGLGVTLDKPYVEVIVFGLCKF